MSAVNPPTAFPKSGRNRLRYYSDFIASLVDKHGPTSDDDAEVYDVVDRVYHDLHSGVLVHDDIRLLRRTFDYTLSSCETLQGHAFVKPYGYPGDFALFDKLYTRHVNSRPSLTRWDQFFHRLDATKAVRNRKNWFIEQLGNHRAESGDLRVLIVGSGPGRDVLEILSRRDNTKIDCVELDPRAIDYAKRLCAPVLGNVRFHQGSILRYRPDVRYDLIWCGGLFDYFNDRVFCRALNHLRDMSNRHGEIIIGNFASPNSSRGFMELVSDWKLTLRTNQELNRLARDANLKGSRIRVDAEPTGVNLFLRILS